MFYGNQNLRLGRGDRKGAMRLAIFVFLLTSVRGCSLLIMFLFGEFAVMLTLCRMLYLPAFFGWLHRAGTVPCAGVAAPDYFMTRLLG